MSICQICNLQSARTMVVWLCAVVVTAFGWLVTAHGATSLSVTPAQISIATQIQEVQRGTIDGQDFLTVQIGGQEIGPSNCRGNILRMSSASESGTNNRQEEIETIALTAMLSASTVVVVVPLDLSQCVDGKPTFTDIYPFSQRPQ